MRQTFKKIIGTTDSQKSQNRRPGKVLIQDEQLKGRSIWEKFSIIKCKYKTSFNEKTENGK